MKVQISVGVQEFWMKTVNERDSFLNLPFQDHLPDLYSLIQRVQIHTGLNAWLHPELLCSLLKTFCKTQTPINLVVIILLHKWNVTDHNCTNGLLTSNMKNYLMLPVTVRIMHVLIRKNCQLLLWIDRGVKLIQVLKNI